MADESVLRAWAREAVKTGKLPDRPPERIWGGPGSGAPCAMCGKTVANEDVEFELQFASDQGPGAANCHVHARCFAAWELERRNGTPTGHSLPEGSSEGIIQARERNTTTQGGRG